LVVRGLMKLKAFSITLVVIIVAATIYPGPLPIKRQIKTAANSSNIVFYWRPSGLSGLFGDNPWVYAVDSLPSGKSEVIAKVWADTPCDGVEKLSKQLSLSNIQCGEAP